MSAENLINILQDADLPHSDDFDLKPAVGGKLAATFFDGGAMVVYQNTSSESMIMLDNVSRYGAEILHGIVP